MWLDSVKVSLIFDRRKVSSASSPGTIEVRMTYRGDQKIFSSGKRVLPKEWKSGQVVNRLDANQINAYLADLVSRIRKILTDMEAEGHIDIHAVPKILTQNQTRESRTFIDFSRERAEIRKHGKAADTQERYDRILRFLEEYGKIRFFHDLTEKKIIDLDNYLSRKNNMKAKSRSNNYHRFIQMFAEDAKKAGLVRINPYDNLNLDRGDDGDAIDKFLYPDEFQRLRVAEMPTERLRRVRDLFVFQTYTCLAYHDLALFSEKKFSEIEQLDVIYGRRQKTNIEYIIPLLAPAREILQKYHGLPAPLTTKKIGKGNILTNQKYNDALKDVVAAAGIDRPVTTHWARHTGATMLLNAGVDIHVVSKVCGHSTIKTTEKIYAKLLESTVVTEVKKVEDKLI